MNCHYNHNGHFSCLEISRLVILHLWGFPLSTLLYQYHLGRYQQALCSGIPNKTVFEAIAFVFIMHTFGVGVQGVANSFQLREYYKEASCQRRWNHGFLDWYLEMPPEFGNDPDPSVKHIQRPQSAQHKWIPKIHFLLEEASNLCLPVETLKRLIP